MPNNAFTVYVNTPQIDTLITQLRALGDDDLDAMLGDIARLVGVKLEEISGVYPPQPEPRPPKKRYSKRTGRELKVKPRKRYKRTGVLGGSLTSEPRKIGALAWLAVLGTNIDYAPYVWGLPDDEPGQAWFHQGIWTPLAVDVRNNIELIRQFIISELKRRIKDRLGK